MLAQAIGFFIWIVGAGSVLGSIVAFIIMENSRVDGISVLPAANRPSRYADDLLMPAGRIAKKWCLRFITAAVCCLFAFAALVIFLAD